MSSQSEYPSHPPPRISVEAFLWHPHSIRFDAVRGKYKYNDQLLANMDDEIEISNPTENCATEEGKSSLQVELPPRLVVRGAHEYDLQARYDAY